MGQRANSPIQSPFATMLDILQVWWEVFHRLTSLHFEDYTIFTVFCTHFSIWLIWYSLANKSSVWWFQTCFFFFIFHNIWDNPSHWRIFFRGVGIPPTSWISSLRSYIRMQKNKTNPSPRPGPVGFMIGFWDFNWLHPKSWWFCLVNHRKTIGKWWFNGVLWWFDGI